MEKCSALVEIGKGKKMKSSLNNFVYSLSENGDIQWANEDGEVYGHGAAERVLAADFTEWKGKRIAPLHKHLSFGKAADMLYKDGNICMTITGRTSIVGNTMIMADNGCVWPRLVFYPSKKEVVVDSFNLGYLYNIFYIQDIEKVIDNS